MYFIAIQRDGINLEGVVRVVEAASGLEAEPVAVPRAGEMTVLDDARLHLRPLMGTFVFAGEDLSLDIDQQDLPAVDRDQLFTEIRDF